MQIVFDDGSQRRELDLRVNNPAATVADLADALGDTGERPLLIGDQRADPDLELVDAVCSRAPSSASAPAASSRRGRSRRRERADRELVVVNGLDAGRRFPLGSGTSVLGRAPGGDIVLRHATVSKRHAAITLTPDGRLTIDDLDSHNGTWVAGTPVMEPVEIEDRTPVRLGALELEVRSVRDDDRPIAVDPVRHTTAAGTIPFNRPPRPAPAPPAAPVRQPQPPRAGGGKTPFSIVSILAPLVFAGAMFAVMKSPQYLLFAGLSPVMATANAIEGRRRRRKTQRTDQTRFRAELAEFEEGLADATEAERERRLNAHPDPPEIHRRVTLPSTTLWERRPDHDDFLVLRAGLGDVPVAPPVLESDRSTPPPDELKDLLREASTLRRAPVTVDLSGGGVVGIVGDRGAALALARSLVVQAAALHGPADVPVMVLARNGEETAWDWVKWLPHTRDSTGTARLLSADRELSTRLVESHLKADRDDARGRRDRDAPARGPAVLVVVDDESLTEGRKAPTRNLLRGDGGPVAGIVVASATDRLPAVCTIVIEMRGADGDADLTLPQRGERITGFLAAGLSPDVARECARALARFEDPELDLVGAGLPASIRLLPLLDLEECTAEAITARWKAGEAIRAPPHPSACPRTASSPSTSSATAPTDWSAGRPGPASPSCCARWSQAWRPASTPTT